jgi:hypothetical protein
MYKHHFRKFRYGYGLLTAIAALLLIRALLPLAVKDYVNHELTVSTRYHGHVDHIRLALWRGAYRIDGIEIRQLDSASKEPLVRADSMEVAVLWNALLDGMIVTRIHAINPRLNFAAAHAGGAAQMGKGVNWFELLKKLSPFRIDRLEMDNGQVHYYDDNSEPVVDIYLSNINAVLTNLSNHESRQQRRVAMLHLDALAAGQAELALDLQIDPFAQSPNFTLKERLIGLEVVRLRDFLRAYTLMDPKQGTLDVITELNAKDGRVQGYVKPLFHHLELLQWKHIAEEKDPLHFLADALGSVLNVVFQNQSKDQLATVVPIDGRLDGPNVDVLDTIGNLLKNAVVQSYKPTFEKDLKSR